METLHYKIEVFDTINASDEEADLYFDFQDTLREEYDPDEPKVDRELRLKYLREKHPFYDTRTWVVKSDMEKTERIIGSSMVRWTEKAHPGYEKNKSTGGLFAKIIKEYRNQGIGTELIKIGLEELRKHPEVKTIIQGSEFDYVWELMEKYGGTFSQAGAENRMYFDKLDWNMVNEWKQKGDKLAKEEGVTLRFFDRVPDDILEDYVEILQETANQQPLGEWDGEVTITPESLRMEEKRNEEKNMEEYTLISIEQNGTISGLTWINRHKEIAHKGMQGLTGVREQYRSRGLGKWLKAEMLLRMKDKFPEWNYISTGMDNTNAPMQSINQRLGFKPYKQFKSYKFNLQDLIKRFNEAYP